MPKWGRAGGWGNFIARGPAPLHSREANRCDFITYLSIFTFAQYTYTCIHTYNTYIMCIFRKCMNVCIGRQIDRSTYIHADVCVQACSRMRAHAHRQGDRDREREIEIWQNQWDNLLRHIMGITAAMEVWEPSTASSSGEEANATGENSVNLLKVEGQEEEPNRQAQDGGAQFSPTDENPGRVDDGETPGGQDGPTQRSGDENAPLDENGEVE